VATVSIWAYYSTQLQLKKQYCPPKGGSHSSHGSPLNTSLEVGPFNPARGIGERCKLPPAGGWGSTPAEIEFGTF